MPRHSVGYDMDQSGLDLPGDLERKPENFPTTPDEEIVVAASASMEQSEPAPVVQAYSVTPEVSERERREEEEREFLRKQEQEREFQVQRRILIGHFNRETIVGQLLYDNCKIVK
jgi:hypothetical protein